MAGVEMVVSRPMGRVLVVCTPTGRGGLLSTLQQLGFQCTEADDPYRATVELCRRPLAYRGVVMSLAGVYREELALITMVKRRFPHMEVWLAHTDGRAATLAEASRLGADGLLSEQGLHRFGTAASQGQALNLSKAPPPPEATTAPAITEAEADPALDLDSPEGEAVLTADELRALLQDPPVRSPVREELS